MSGPITRAAVQALLDQAVRERDAAARQHEQAMANYNAANGAVMALTKLLADAESVPPEA